MAWVFPGAGAHDHEHILHPSGKNCPVREGYRLVRSARRPCPVFKCYPQCKLRFSIKITTQIAFKIDGGGEDKFLHPRLR